MCGSPAVKHAQSKMGTREELAQWLAASKLRAREHAALGTPATAVDVQWCHAIIESALIAYDSLKIDHLRAVMARDDLSAELAALAEQARAASACAGAADLQRENAALKEALTHIAAIAGKCAGVEGAGVSSGRS